MTTPIHRFVISQFSDQHAKTLELLETAKIAGFTGISEIICQDIFFVQGDLSEQEKVVLVNQLISDPITQKCYWHNDDVHNAANDQVVEIALRPGVTDPVAEQIIHSSRVLGIHTIERAATGQRFIIRAQHQLDNQNLLQLVQSIWMNPIIHYCALGQITPVFPEDAKSIPHTEVIPIRELTDDQLLKLSRERRAALNLQEMQSITDHFRELNRDPTDVEFETIAQTWSEHCSHKTFKAEITTEPNHQIIKGLLKSYIRAATEKINAKWVWSAFVDNAGIIDFDDEYQIAFKVETHNHPSAIEPFGGANTGLGGVIRDILGVSAKPIAATDIFCFGFSDTEFQQLPAGVLHPARIRAGVVAGVQDYGNKTGIPTVNGAICYDAAYTANPLVFCGCVGLLPKNSHPSSPKPSDRIILLGGRTGRDGLRGATFSSMTMDAQTGEVASASVQIGHPIIAKGLIEVVIRARDAKLYHAITDCGAGGLSSAVGEMAQHLGAVINLEIVPLKYSGLSPWEIWLSEAQERMVMAVPANNIAALKTLCDVYAIELTDLGHFTNDHYLRVFHGKSEVLNLSNDFLFNQMPIPILTAKVADSKKSQKQKFVNYDLTVTENNIATHNDSLCLLLSHPNIASKAKIIRLYDHEVQGGTVVKPLTGANNDGPSDACVLKPQGTKGVRGIVLANGINPELGKYDPYNMALSVIDEAIRNAVAVGANPDRIALLDNFSWGDTRDTEVLGALVAAVEGCYDAAIYYQTPFISGKDSLNNAYIGKDNIRHSIPHTLLISVLGIIDDITHAVTMDFKQAGNLVYLIDSQAPVLLGSHYQLCVAKDQAQENCDNKVVNLSEHHNDEAISGLPENAPEMYRSIHNAISQQLIQACHDLSEGGLAVSVAEMCMAGRLGCELVLENSQNTVADLFGESNGRFLIEVTPDNNAAFLNCFPDKLREKIKLLGHVTQSPLLNIKKNNRSLIELSVDELLTAWQGKK